MKYILSGIFLVFVFIPLIGDLAGITTGNSLEENRHIKGYEELSLPKKVALYIKNFDSRFWGRQYLVRSYIAIKKDFFGVSPLPEKVIIGKEGWLYLSDYGAMDDYRNIRPFSVEQLDSIQAYLRHISKELGQQDIKFYVAVVPDKHTIYPEYLPETVRKVRPVSRLQQLTEHLKKESTFRFINLTDTLQAAKPNGVLYFKEESHWNDRGAFIAYQKIFENIKFDFPGLNELELDSCESFAGKENDLDLAKILGQPIDYTEDTWKIVPRSFSNITTTDAGVSIPPAKRFNTEYAFRKLNPLNTGPSIIVYRDSFFGSLTPFFEQSFSESTYIWTNDIDLEFIKKQNPQLVLLEIAERHIDLLTR